MNQPNSNNPIDPRKLAAKAKVVVQPVPTQPKKVVIPAGKIPFTPAPKPQGLQSLPKPTENPPAQPNQTLGTVIQGPPANDTKQQEPTTEIVPAQTEQASTGPKDGRAATQFKPGQSGNPAGRPPKKYSLDALLEAELQKPHGRLPDGSLVTKGEMINRKLVEKATDGNMKAIEIVTNRLDGKPMQKIQITPPDEAEGTVLANEAQENLMSLYGRKKEHATDNHRTNQGA